MSASDENKRSGSTPGNLLSVPRFSGHVSFFRVPISEGPSGLDVAVCGVPFDGGSTNKVGARSGPRQVREMSHNHIRPVHPVDNTSPFDGVKIGDIGDVAIDPLDQVESLNRIQAYFRDIAAAGAKPLAAGGDHLVSLPILRGLADVHGPAALVHFDAHTDTYDSIFHGASKLDNGTPFRRAVEEKLIIPEKSIQIGIRGPRFGFQDLDFSLESGMTVITIDDFFEMGAKAVAEKVHEVVGDTPAYLTFDVDALDASFVPGTGAPEIGGFTTRDAQVMLRGLAGMNFVGSDVVEVCPPLDPSGGTALVAANMMFEQLYLLVANTKKG